MKRRGYLERAGGSFVGAMFAYLRDQLQMGAGIPMDAIEKGQVAEWMSPFKPMSVAQVEVLGTALRQPGCKLRALWLGEGGIDAAGAVVLAKALAVEKASVELLWMGGCGLGAECVAPLVEMLEVNTSITMLCLEGNPFGPESVAPLVEMLKVNTTPKELNLNRNEFDEAAEQQLRDAAKEREERTGVELYLGV